MQPTQRPLSMSKAFLGATALAASLKLAHDYYEVSCERKREQLAAEEIARQEFQNNSRYEKFFADRESAFAPSVDPHHLRGETQRRKLFADEIGRLVQQLEDRLGWTGRSESVGVALCVVALWGDVDLVLDFLCTFVFARGPAPVGIGCTRISLEAERVVRQWLLQLCDTFPRALPLGKSVLRPHRDAERDNRLRSMSMLILQQCAAGKAVAVGPIPVDGLGGPAAVARFVRLCRGFGLGVAPVIMTGDDHDGRRAQDRWCSLHGVCHFRLEVYAPSVQCPQLAEVYREELRYLDTYVALAAGKAVPGPVPPLSKLAKYFEGKAKKEKLLLPRRRHGLPHFDIARLRAIFEGDLRAATAVPPGTPGKRCFVYAGDGRHLNDCQGLLDKQKGAQSMDGGSLVVTNFRHASFEVRDDVGAATVATPLAGADQCQCVSEKGLFACMRERGWLGGGGPGGNRQGPGAEVGFHLGGTTPNWWSSPRGELPVAPGIQYELLQDFDTEFQLGSEARVLLQRLGMDDASPGVLLGAGLEHCCALSGSIQGAAAVLEVGEHLRAEDLACFATPARRAALVQVLAQALQG